MDIYKIFRPAEFEALRQSGESTGAPIDRDDGYIHFSTADQVAETLSKHFAGAGDLVLCVCDADALGKALKWEPSRGGALFPHLYRPLAWGDIAWHAPLFEENGAHPLPGRVG